MIDVTIDIRDLDATGSAPAHATVRFARLNPTSVGGVLVTAGSIPVSLTDGHGTIQLEPQTAYRVSASGIAGVRTSFAILTGSVATSLADLWQTGQINPGDYTAIPVPEPLDEALAAIRADIAALQADDSSYAGVQYQQVTPSAQWSIPHSIGRQPTVAIYDPAGALILADVTSSPALVLITFANPTAGSAVLT